MLSELSDTPLKELSSLYYNLELSTIDEFANYESTKRNDSLAHKFVAVQAFLTIFNLIKDELIQQQNTKTQREMALKKQERCHYLLLNLFIQFIANTDITGEPIHEYTHSGQTGAKGFFSSNIDAAKNMVANKLILNDIGTLIPAVLNSMCSAINKDINPPGFSPLGIMTPAI